VIMLLLVIIVAGSLVRNFPPNFYVDHDRGDPQLDATVSKFAQVFPYSTGSGPTYVSPTLWPFLTYQVGADFGTRYPLKIGSAECPSITPTRLIIMDTLYERQTTLSCSNHVNIIYVDGRTEVFLLA